MLSLKEYVYKKIQIVCTKFNINLYAFDYFESSSLLTWRFRFSDRVDDIIKYEKDFKVMIHENLGIYAKDNLIVITLPKVNRDIIYLDNILKSDWFNGCTGILKVAVGETIEGYKYMFNIEENEHILIAGTTGSGKSLFMHTIIHSLVYCNSPDVVKFVLIDFKGSEFSYYENNSYLYLPVIYELDHAVKSLEKIVVEMERRFKYLRNEGYQNIFDYNNNSFNKLPYIIVMIDEFTKLTLFNNNSEKLLLDLSQRGRASGIFLILTVHKPTSDSINTSIKEMFNTRIAFKLNSANASRSIIDSGEAVDLLGKGDMIILDHTGSERIQSSFISKEDIKNLGLIYKDDNLFNETDNKDVKEIFEEVKKVDESYRNFYRASRKCLELGICNKKTIYDTVRVGKREQQEILDKMIREGIVSDVKSYYGRNDIIMSLEEFLSKYEEV